MLSPHQLHVSLQIVWVAFRGTWSLEDWASNLASIVPGDEMKDERFQKNLQAAPNPSRPSNHPPLPTPTPPHPAPPQPIPSLLNPHQPRLLSRPAQICTLRTILAIRTHIGCPGRPTQVCTLQDDQTYGALARRCSIMRCAITRRGVLACSLECLARRKHASSPSHPHLIPTSSPSHRIISDGIGSHHIGPQNIPRHIRSQLGVFRLDVVTPARQVTWLICSGGS